MLAKRLTPERTSVTFEQQRLHDHRVCSLLTRVHQL